MLHITSALCHLHLPLRRYTETDTESEEIWFSNVPCFSVISTFGLCTQDVLHLIQIIRTVAEISSRQCFVIQK